MASEKYSNNKLREELKKHNIEHGPRDLTPGDITKNQVIFVLLLTGGILGISYLAANPDFLSKLIGN